MNLLRAIQNNLANVVIALCVVGAFSLSYSPFNIWIMLIFGVLGYLLKKNDYPTAPFILAVVLTPLAENYFRQSVMLGQGSAMIFIERPISLIILSLMILIVVGTVFGRLRARSMRDMASADE